MAPLGSDRVTRRASRPRTEEDLATLEGVAPADDVRNLGQARRLLGFGKLQLPDQWLGLAPDLFGIALQGPLEGLLASRSEARGTGRGK